MYSHLIEIVLTPHVLQLVRVHEWVLPWKQRILTFQLNLLVSLNENDKITNPN